MPPRINKPHTERRVKESRRRWLVGAASAGALAIEELTFGLIRKGIERLFSGHEADKKDPMQTISGEKLDVVKQPGNEAEEVKPANTVNKIDTANTYKMNIEVDGMTFVSNTLDEKTFLEAYNFAKQKIGGPYWKPDKPCNIEIIDPSNTISTTSVGEGKIHTVSIALPHEIIHYILGVDSLSNRWPAVLMEFLAHSASPLEGVDRYKFEDLNGPFISMTNHEGATTRARNFFYDARKEAFVKLNDAIGNEKRKEIAQAALKKERITFEELADFLKQFGLEHPIFQKGEQGIQKQVLYGHAENDGREFLLPVIYERKEQDETPVNMEIAFQLRDKKGNEIQVVRLKIGTEVRNAYPIMLNDFFKFLSRQSTPITREMVGSIFIPQTGQTIVLDER